jgi:hypothetical protein
MEPLFLPYPDADATFDPPPDLESINLDGVPITSPGWECEIYNATSYHIPIAYAISQPFFVLRGAYWYVQQIFISNVEIVSGFDGPLYVPEFRNGLILGDPTFSISVGADDFPAWHLIDGTQRQKSSPHISRVVVCPHYEEDIEDGIVKFQSPNFELPLAEWEARNLYPPPGIAIFDFETWQTADYQIGLWERPPAGKGPGCSALATIGKILIATEGS